MGVLMELYVWVFTMSGDVPAATLKLARQQEI
jgi:hypothetical protein